MPTPCPGCNKFASLEVGEPEVDNFEVSDDGFVTGDVRVALISGCCGEEMKEHIFNIEHQLEPVAEGTPENVGATATVDEVKIKGRKAYKVIIELSVSGDGIKDALKTSVEETVLAGEMEDMT